jgi:hypothetical protein
MTSGTCCGGTGGGDRGLLIVMMEETAVNPGSYHTSGVAEQAVESNRRKRRVLAFPSLQSQAKWLKRAFSLRSQQADPKGTSELQ